MRRNACATTLQPHAKASAAWVGFSEGGALATAALDGELLVYDAPSPTVETAATGPGPAVGPDGEVRVGGVGGGGTGKARRQRATAVCTGAAAGAALAWGKRAGAGWLFALAPGELQAWGPPGVS